MAYEREVEHREEMARCVKRMYTLKEESDELKRKVAVLERRVDTIRGEQNDVMRSLHEARKLLERNTFKLAGVEDVLREKVRLDGKVGRMNGVVKRLN